MNPEVLKMNKTIGILAHVEAGKTTFAEQILYHTKIIKNKCRYSLYVHINILFKGSSFFGKWRGSRKVYACSF